MANPNTQTAPNRGPLFAAMLGSVWLAAHLYALFFHTVGSPWVLTLALIGLQLWLYTGLFIVAHDTMHGSFAPGRPRVNAWVGRVILFWYAGFSWSAMRTAHHQHHDTPGTAEDPDFNADNPRDFWPWYLSFFLRYFSWRQIVVLGAIGALYTLLGAPYINLIVMWAVPAILSSVQLFYFGTYLTHRHAEAFPDEHLARTNDYPRWLSLLTCFHFGYHHEHHLYPNEPWWRLPARKLAHKQALKLALEQEQSS
ncbi:beta-carotene ketolase [Algimonas ampicilliniresistens]|uniref:Beta-carotene ketolase n=1 Tax=Algimonas ampicilliniresistens TaxID=1298735 RepID=A0ABQ5V9L2_9PROT|nr:fatty acid desaturase [Algimonas ampicilliniresistens]GLQ23345.1 beta-carotene ketolase [Algimonas ampicilliniresistens]